MHNPLNTAARAVVRSPGKAAPLGVLCLRKGAFTFLLICLHYRCLSVRARYGHQRYSESRKPPFLQGTSCSHVMRSFFGAPFCNTWGVPLHLSVRFFNHAVLVLIAWHNLVIWHDIVS